MNFSNICLFFQKGMIYYSDWNLYASFSCGAQVRSIYKIFRKSCGWNKPFFWFLLMPKVSKIIDLIIFHIGVRWVAYTGNWSFSRCNKWPFAFFLCLLLVTLWQYRNLMLILLIRSITQDVLTYWTGSSALDIGKS